MFHNDIIFLTSITGVLIYSLDTIEEKINFLMNGGSDAYINSSKNSTIKNEGECQLLFITRLSCYFQ